LNSKWRATPSFAPIRSRGGFGKGLHLLLLSALVSLCLTTACSPRDFLTRRLAADLIAGSDTFKATQKYWLRIGTMSNQDFSSPESMVLQNRGWITAAKVACPAAVAPPPCWDVALTPLGVGVFRDLIPANASQSQYFSVPVARRQLVGVTGISKSGASADVDFLWKWVPLNDVGQALYAGDVQYKSTVTFRLYDDGWRVVEAALPKTNQGLDEALKNAQAAQ
jgi:hypothetical protein